MLHCIVLQSNTLNSITLYSITLCTIIDGGPRWCLSTTWIVWFVRHGLYGWYCIYNHPTGLFGWYCIWLVLVCVRFVRHGLYCLCLEYFHGLTIPRHGLYGWYDMDGMVCTTWIVWFVRHGLYGLCLEGAPDGAPPRHPATEVGAHNIICK